MNTLKSHKYLAPLAVLAYLCSFMMMPMASAGVIGTQTMLEQGARQAQVEHVQQLLSQSTVEEQMIALGVNPADAKLRVASLTDSELRAIEGQLEQLPAGGSALVIIGAVFLVLLILELVGVTNVFNRL